MPPIEGILSRKWGVALMDLTGMFKSVTNILDKLDIRYWLEWGTLLGIVRDNKLIPWDRDIDLGTFGIPDGARRKEISEKLSASGYISMWDFEPLADVHTSLTMSGLSRVSVGLEIIDPHRGNWSFEGETLAANLSFYNTPPARSYMDIGYIRTTKGERIKTVAGPSFPYEMFLSCAYVEFEGNWFYVPDPPEEYLRLAFGKDWRIPKQKDYENDWRDNP